MSAPSLHSVQSSHRTFLMAMKKLKAYFTLTKPGITIFMIFTAICAAIVAKGEWPDVWAMALVTIGLALSAGGAASINMWYDRDIDKIMKRTMERPLPTGQLRPQSALIFGIGLELLSLIWFWVFVNGLTAILSLAGFLYYTVIYTMWLKRRTPQNIVIGGGAGAIPPMIGWSAMTGELGWPAVIMFAIIFFWTPPHFWPLVIVKNDDYVRAGIPMMPVVSGQRNTKRQCIFYTFVLLLISFGLYFTGAVGGFYLAGAILSGLAFFYFQIRMWYEQDDHTMWAKRAFFASLVYLPVLFIFMVIDSLF
ncbi:heme o synthase [Thermoflavimicrobium dichotomicum]|uniref:Protoheme IX farnesyltransferase n=1 Tax=Thermoflavimicrobium dichotomicum TaxID=46223 RepID=A0A1I3KGY9_9BACL|nr:heme o synthase [Thermoflavimicrobium dichotomicum]SFI71779.1 protoheme IX farnesyltransferase [Thermoflavimicrobium dichotomicum]